MVALIRNVLGLTILGLTGFSLYNMLLFSSIMPLIVKLMVITIVSGFIGCAFLVLKIPGESRNQALGRDFVYFSVVAFVTCFLALMLITPH